jgi:hypothetical protein
MYAQDALPCTSTPYRQPKPVHFAAGRMGKIW